MKKRAAIIVSITVIIIGIVLAVMLLKKSDTIVGKWSRVEQVTNSSSDNAVTGFIFEADGSYESYRILSKGEKKSECRTYGNWTVEEDGTLVVNISDTKVDGKSDYHDENDWSKNQLKRDKAYTKRYRKDIAAKKCDAVQCYYVENGILYINGNAYGDNYVAKVKDQESGSVVLESAISIMFEMNYVILDPSGTYEVRDITENGYFQYAKQGHYIMYDNKLILQVDNNRMELQFYKDGNNWLYDAESSYGLVRTDKISDLAIFSTTEYPK